MWPFDDIGDSIGTKLKELVSSAFESAMQALWDASLWILREAFRLADRVSVFTVDTHSGPVAVLWPMMLWVSGVLALGLFFWQITMTSLRGGRGFMRLVGGPVQYGIALAITVGMVGGFLAAADGVTDGILLYGLQSRNFQDALLHTTFGEGAVNGVAAVILGICAVIGVIPAAIGYVLEMLFREAAVYVLVAVVPVAAAGLLANITKSWFWKTVRWILACIAMKPVLALTLVLGLAIAGGSKDLFGLLAGIGVLIISLLVPFVLFRLFAFVDPNSDAGTAFRDALSGLGVSSYGSHNPAMLAAGAALGGSGGGSDAQESANSGRFDQALSDAAGETAGFANEEMDDNGIGNGSGEDGNDDGGDGEDGSQPGGSPTDPDSSDGPASPPANRGQVTSRDGIGPQGVDSEPADSTDSPGGSEGGASGGETPVPEYESPPEYQPYGGGGGSGSDNGGETPPPEPPPDDNGPGHDNGGDDGGGGGSPRGGGGGGPKPTGGGGGASGETAAAEEAAVIV